MHIYIYIYIYIYRARFSSKIWFCESRTICKISNFMMPSYYYYWEMGFVITDGIVCSVLLCVFISRLKSARVTDKRVRVMNEIISGMRLIKMYAWEWAFHEYVKKIRKSAFIVVESSPYCFIAGRKSRLLLKLV